MGAVFFLGGRTEWTVWTRWTAEAKYPGEAQKPARPRVFFLVLFLCRYKEKVQDTPGQSPEKKKKEFAKKRKKMYLHRTNL
jgi:hypothetical protein